MTDPTVKRFTGSDGLRLAYRELGDGRPLVLLHGFTGDGRQWIDPGHAATFAELGYRVIVPDMRGHGDSAKPRDPELYPPDVLTDDGLALIEWLGLADYDLGGYSLGARTVVRMLVRRARPARAILGGLGLAVVDQWPGYASRYGRVLSAMLGGDALEPGSPEAEQARRIVQVGGDPQALLHVLETHVATPQAALSEITTPALVVAGDQDPNSAEALAAALQNARATRIPGNHVTALASPALAKEIVAFLGRPSAGLDAVAITQQGR